MLLPANLVIGSVQRDVPRQHVEIKVLFEKKLRFKNYKFISASSIQIGLVSRALALKNLKLDINFIKFSKLLEGVIQKHCFYISYEVALKLLIIVIGYMIY
jgi:hypothetical protein